MTPEDTGRCDCPKCTLQAEQEWWANPPFAKANPTRARFWLTVGVLVFIAACTIACQVIR